MNDTKRVTPNNIIYLNNILYLKIQGEYDYDNKIESEETTNEKEKYIYSDESREEVDQILNELSEEKKDNVELINIENADFSNKNKIINSPRTLKACKELGILPSELYKISIEEYKKKNKSYFTLDQKMLKLRYDGYEKFRKDSVNLVKKRRDILINREKEKEKKDKETTTNMDKLSRKSKTEISFISQSIERMKIGEKRAMENLKNQQRKNIKNLIEEQINHEMIKKMEQKKEWRQQKREEQIEKEKKEYEVVKKKAEDELNERKKKIEEKNLKKEELYRQKLKEQNNLDEEMKIKKKLEYEYNQRKLFEENEKYLKKKEEMREKIEKALDDLRMRIEQKDKTIDERIQIHLEKQEKKLEEAKKKNQEKQNRIMKNLQYNEEERNNEINLLMLHQSHIDQNVILSKLKTKEKISKQAEVISSKFAINQDKRNQLEESQIRKVEEMKEKNKQAEERFEAKKKEEEEILKQKKEERKMKEMEREIVNERKKRIEIMEKEKKIEEINEKEKKIKEILEQKNQMIKEREKNQIKMNKQRDNMLKFIDNIKKQNKEIEPEMIKEMFPDDETLYKEVVKMKELQKEEERRKKLNNYENESVNFNVTYNYLNKTKTFRSEEFNKSKINKNTNTSNQNINTNNYDGKDVSDVVEETDEINDIDSYNRLKKETYLTAFNNRVRENNKKMPRIPAKSIADLESQNYLYKMPIAEENESNSVSLVKSINLNSVRNISLHKNKNMSKKNKSNLMPLTIPIKTEYNNENPRINKFNSKNKSKPKNSETSQSKKQIEFVHYKDKKIQLPEISDYKKINNKNIKTNNRETIDLKDHDNYNHNRNRTVNATNNRNNRVDSYTKDKINSNNSNLNNNNYNKEKSNYQNQKDLDSIEENKYKDNNEDVSAMNLELDKEKDIENKIEEYKFELHNNFLKLLESEKKADIQRNEKIEKEKDPNKRKKLEEENEKEKINLAKRIKKYTEDMEIKINAYEQKLKGKK